VRYLKNSNRELLHSCNCSSRLKIIFDGSILPTTSLGQNCHISFFGNAYNMAAGHDRLPLRVLRREGER
jgi:hypothetical protein